MLINWQASSPPPASIWFHWILSHPPFFTAFIRHTCIKFEHGTNIPWENLLSFFWSAKFKYNFPCTASDIQENSIIRWLNHFMDTIRKFITKYNTCQSVELLEKLQGKMAIQGTYGVVMEYNKELWFSHYHPVARAYEYDVIINCSSWPHLCQSQVNLSRRQAHTHLPPDADLPN